MHNPICLSFVSRFFIRRIKPTPLVMHRRWLIQLPKRNSLAVRADGDRVVRIVLEKLEFCVAAVAEVSVDGHPLMPSETPLPDGYSAS